MIIGNISKKTKIENLISIIDKNIDGISVYLFGSALYKNDPNDIDVLFVYNNLETKNIYKIIKSIGKEMESFYNKNIHYMVLSKNEVTQTKIFEKIEYEKLL